MKYMSLLSLAITIIFSAIGGAWISHQKVTEKNIQVLLSSPSTIDQLNGIEKVKHESFDSLVVRLSPLLQGDVRVVNAASNTLVKCAFRESRIDELEKFKLDPALLASVKWWRSNKNSIPPNPTQLKLACEVEVAPWLRRLASLHCQSLELACAKALTTMPLRDRDGSVLLATLSMHKHTKHVRITSWNNSIDADQRKVSLLLQGLENETIEHTDSDPHMQHLANILSNKNGVLAWRSMHQDDGFINPDIFLAGLIVDNGGFLQLLVESATDNLWQYPEHPVELARIFTPEVVQFLPDTMLGTIEDRVKWWNLFACGLLLEER